MMEISPQERTKINALVSRLGMQQITADTNIMAWVLPVLEKLAERIQMQERRIREIEERSPQWPTLKGPE
jgi:hypothetical protein